MSILSVENIGKAYKTYHPEWKRFLTWLGLKSEAQTEHWVLRHISFKLARGEAIGIIGQNGAGKSTLLKLITGTLQPNEGCIRIDGRISAMLELGLGFSPELTGRENALHVSGLMGIPMNEILESLPAIAAFAEIGAYFDEPLRTYSSGMQARLAFSVATAFRPDILIVDEVLAVGDAYFVHKSQQRIRSFQEEGTSLLVVAHDADAIQTLCDRAILLDQGRCLMEGEPGPVLDFYNALIADRESATIRQEREPEGAYRTISGSGEARVESLSLLNEEGQELEWVRVGQKVRLIVNIKIHEPINELVFGYQIKDRLGRIVFGTNTHLLDIPLRHLEKGEALKIDCGFTANMGIGSYSISTALHTGDNHLLKNYEWRDLALMLTVYNHDQQDFIGLNWLPPEIEITKC